MDGRASCTSSGQKKQVCNGLEISNIWINRNCWFHFFLICKMVLKLSQTENLKHSLGQKNHKSSIRSRPHIRENINCSNNRICSSPRFDLEQPMYQNGPVYSYDTLQALHAHVPSARVLRMIHIYLFRNCGGIPHPMLYRFLQHDDGPIFPKTN